jgi:membrane protein DedA with SNARE-associated domain
VVSFWAPESAKAAAQRAQRVHTLHWLTHFGLPGLFAVSIIDSSPIPLPIPGTTDLLLLWLTSHRGNPFLLCLSAVAGAFIGGYTGWHVGRKGGEAALRKRVPPRLLNPVCHWAKSNSFLAVFLPALLPPPVPLSPFVFAAGALGVPRQRFLIAFGTARAIRYSLVAWLGATYGRHVIRMWANTLDRWSVPLLVLFGVTILGAIVTAVIKARTRPRSELATRPARETAAD